MYPTGYQHPSYTYGTQASQNAARAAAEAAATAAATAAFRATGRPSSAVAATINSGYVKYRHQHDPFATESNILSLT